MKRAVLCIAALALSACAYFQDRDQTDAACAPETFSVYFGLNETELSEPAETMLDQAAQRWTGCPQGRLQVVGLADAVGDPEINQQISEQRAQAVVEGLESRGVLPARIVVMAFGDRGATTPGGENVPMRRRVEVRFQPAPGS